MRQRKNKFDEMKYDRSWVYDLHYGVRSQSITFSNYFYVKRKDALCIYYLKLQNILNESKSKLFNLNFTCDFINYALYIGTLICA